MQRWQNLHPSRLRYTLAAPGCQKEQNFPPDFKVFSHPLHYETKINVSCFTYYLLGTFHLHALILCVSEGVLLSDLLCIQFVGKETFVLFGLILCVAEGFLSKLLCIPIVGMGAFHLHALI